jgi:hypothetical protein
MKAWRIWDISLATQELKSALDPRRVSNPTVWKPGVNAASCKFHARHNPPEADGRCGFRGQESIETLIWWLYEWKHVDAAVVGGVELSGNWVYGDPAHPEIPAVVRSQYAEIVGPLFMWPSYYKALGRKVACDYGVKVYPARSMTPGQWIRTIPLERFE